MMCKSSYVIINNYNHRKILLNYFDRRQNLCLPTKLIGQLNGLGVPFQLEFYL